MNLKYSVGTDVDSKTLEVNLSVIDDQQNVTVVSSRIFGNIDSDHRQIVNWVEKSRSDKKLPVVYWRRLSRKVCFVFAQTRLSGQYHLSQ